MWKTIEAPLQAAADGSLKKVVQQECPIELTSYAALETLGRVLCGTAPWLECRGVPEAERPQQQIARKYALEALRKAVSADEAYGLNFNKGHQPLVDAALLALALHRAPKELWDKLDQHDQSRLLNALESTRGINPLPTNWILFSAFIEAFLASKGRRHQSKRIVYALRCFEQWYLGDGVYGDGRPFAADYYNSFIIHPFLMALIDLSDVMRRKVSENTKTRIIKRAQRYAEIQERTIGSDGSYPLYGRSITYRCGAFHHLADMSMRELLPGSISETAVRRALGSVIKWSLDAEHTFRADKWLSVGVRGRQPQLAEKYISPGSLYFACTVFLPLGLQEDNVFWNSSNHNWTSMAASKCEGITMDQSIGKERTLIDKTFKLQGWERVFYPKFPSVLNRFM